MNNITKKTMIITLIAAMLLAPALTVLQAHATTLHPPYWDVTNAYLIDVTVVGDPNTYKEQLILVQEGSEITGSIALYPSGTSLWIIDEGFVSGDDIEFGAYMVGQTRRLVFTGTIDSEGFIGGTWADVAPYTRIGNLQVTQENAQPIIISLTLSDGSQLDASIQILTKDDLTGCIPPLPLGIAGEFTPYIEVTILENFEGTVVVRVSYEDKWEDDETFEETLKLYMGDCVDFNLDGTINGKDLAIIMKAIGSDLDPMPLKFDVNNDGDVNQDDVDIVKEYMTKGLIVNQGLDGELQARLPWLEITTWVDPANNYIYGETDHFSIFRGR